MNDHSWARSAVNFFFGLVALLALAGCSEPDPCEDLTCESGICVDGECTVAQEERSCSSSSECTDDEFCTSEGTCAQDPCATTQCDRGQCEVGTGTCVNATFCTAADEATSCLEGSRCVAGTCLDEEALCEDLACERGVCSFGELACVNAESCTSDTECTAGFFCEAGSCAPNQCDQSMTDCPRGTCDAATGECVNPESCASTNECLDGDICIDGACVTETTACAACTGNQVCDYDEAALSVTCVENASGCSNALDCTGERQCVDQACADPIACEPDSAEPNDTIETATSIQNDAATGLSLCSGNVDVFTFNTNADELQRGSLVVDVEIDRADVGLGTLIVDLVDAADSVVASAETTSPAGPTHFARVEHSISFVNSGVYTVRVSSADASTAGVRYSVSADIVEEATLRACDSVRQLDLSVPVAGNTLAGASNALSTSCIDPTGGSAAEEIWSIEVPEPGILTVQATPSIDADISIAMRTNCARDESEVEGTCQDEVGESLPERIILPVEAGEYFLVVQSGESSGGAYTLSAEFNPVICSESENTCIDSETANVCNRYGTGFESVECEFGCADGRCMRDPGDVCSTAHFVNVGTGYTGFVDWSSLSADYDPGRNGCVPNNFNSESDGADAVYEIDIPADNVLVASLDLESGVYGSMYLLTDCQDVESSCIAAANAGRLEDEFLSYHNKSGATEKVFLVADSAMTSSASTSATINIAVEPALCTPGTARCVLNRESQICNSAGTAFDTTVGCEFGCEASTGRCVKPLNDLCGGALPLVAGVESQPQDLSRLANDYNSSTNGSCPVGTGGPKNGPDATFLLQGITAGEVVTVTMTSDFNAALWVAEDCTNDAVGACVAGVDDTFATTPEVLEFIAPRSGDFVVVAEAASANTGTFRVKYTVAPPTCTPNTSFGCSADLTSVDYCDSLGNPQSHTCGTGGCDVPTGQCATPTGDICADAIQVATIAGTATSGTETGSHDEGMTAAINPSPGDHGQCNFVSSPDENDTIYAFDLAPGDLLTINFASSSTAGYGYLLEDCFSTASCQFNFVGSGTHQYLAPASGTVFFVVDHVYASSLDYTFDWSVTPSPGLVCVPGDRTCLSPSQLEVCSADGTSATYQTCSAGCSNFGGCLQDGTNDSCATAIDAGTGVHVVFDPADYTSKVNDGCGLATSGVDAFYSIDLQANELLRVTGVPSSSYDDAVVYIFSDCSDANRSCIDGMQMDSGDATAEAFYLATTAETVKIGLDTDSAYDNTPFYFAIEVLAPECSDADPLVCNAAGTGVEYCQNGLKQSYDCVGTCQAGACQSPTGDTCWDAFDLAAESAPLTRSWQTAEALNNPGPGAVGACAFDDFGAGAGQEHVYRIDLAAGDLLEVQETSPNSTVLYLLGDCLSPQSSCLANDRGTESLAYYADQAETVFLAVDRTSTQTTSGEYTIDWTITQGSLCAPGQSYCADANTASFCIDGVNSTGPYSCANGCVAGACVDDLTMDSCAAAPVLSAGGGISLLYNAADFANDVSVSCAGGSSTEGPDLFFQVDLQPFDIVRARSMGIGNETPAVYILTDCADPANSCIGGGRGSFQSDYEVEVEHQASSVQTVWIGIDSTRATDDELFEVQIDVLTPDCVPGQFENVCNPAGNGIVYCDETGFTRNYLCGGAGVCDPTLNRCAEPVGDACIDPYEATPTSSGTTATFTGDFSTLANDHALPVANSCLPSWTPGNDGAYVVDLVAGQTLTASLVSTVVGNEQDVALYLVNDCADINAACLGGADAHGGSATPETLTYTATADESVTLIVDSFFQNAFGTYQLDVTVN